MAERAEIIKVTFLCPVGSEVSGEFIRGTIGIVPLRCERYPNSCRVTVQRISGNPPKVGILAFHVGGYCAQKKSEIRERIEVDAVPGQNPRSE